MNNEDAKKSTILHKACEMGLTKLVMRLIEQPKSLKVLAKEDSEGNYACMVACANGHIGLGWKVYIKTNKPIEDMRNNANLNIIDLIASSGDDSESTFNIIKEFYMKNNNIIINRSGQAQNRAFGGGFGGQAQNGSTFKIPIIKMLIRGGALGINDKFAFLNDRSIFHHAVTNHCSIDDCMEILDFDGIRFTEADPNNVNTPGSFIASPAIRTAIINYADDDLLRILEKVLSLSLSSSVPTDRVDSFDKFGKFDSNVCIGAILDSADENTMLKAVCKLAKKKCVLYLLSQSDMDPVKHSGASNIVMDFFFEDDEVLSAFTDKFLLNSKIPDEERSKMSQEWLESACSKKLAKTALKLMKIPGLNLLLPMQIAMKNFADEDFADFVEKYFDLTKGESDINAPLNSNALETLSADSTGPTTGSATGSGDTMLHFALRNKQIKTSLKLLEVEGIDINCLNSSDESPLSLLFTTISSEEIVQKLISMPAYNPLNIINAAKDTFLSTACNLVRNKYCGFNTLDADPGVVKRSVSRIFLNVLRSQDKDVLDVVMTPNDKGVTPLYYMLQADMDNSDKILDAIVKSQVNYNVPLNSKSGVNILHGICSNGAEYLFSAYTRSKIYKEALISILNSEGATDLLNSKCLKSGSTPLHFLCGGFKSSVEPVKPKFVNRPLPVFNRATSSFGTPQPPQPINAGSMFPAGMSFSALGEGEKGEGGALGGAVAGGEDVNTKVKDIGRLFESAEASECFKLFFGKPGVNFASLNYQGNSVRISYRSLNFTIRLD